MFTSVDGHGEVVLGKQFGPDGTQLLRIDGPHSAPGEHFAHYKTAMVIGAGIGMTPCASVLTALLRYQWRRAVSTPEILHFYWVVAQQDVPSFEWFVHKIADLQYELLLQRAAKTVARRYYCEINIYVTRAKQIADPPPLKSKRCATRHGALKEPAFSSEELYRELMCPSVKSSQQSSMKGRPNRFQDVRVWDGRPQWEGIFADIERNCIAPDIGVTFCGTPVIGKDLKKMCQKHSHDKRCVFSLHKENF